MTPPGPSPLSFRGLGDPPSAARPGASVVAFAADESVEAWSASAAVALARSWASPERPVRLVDLSVWSPRLAGVLGLEPGDGATDVVLFGADPGGVARPVGDGLEVVAAGKRVWDPARVMADGRLADLLAPPPGGLTAFLVPLDLPGCERALERADAVVLLAPAHADAGFLLGDAVPRAVAWWGPGEGTAREEQRTAGAAAPRPEPLRPEAESLSKAAPAVPEPASEMGAEKASPPSAPVPERRPEAAPPPPEPAPASRPEVSLPAAEVREETTSPPPGPEPFGPTRPPAAEARRGSGSAPDPARGAASAAPSPPSQAPGPVVAGATPVLLEPRGDGAPDGEGGRGVVPPSRRWRGERGGRWTILLAEDNDDHALLVQMSLRWASRKPVLLYRARNGDEAIRLLDGVVPDLLLLDLKMPGRTGLEVLEHVKGADGLRRIPVAVLTSSDRDEDVERAYGLGGNHFLTKPDDPRKLQQQLRTLLDNLWELSSIRRGRGVMEATGVTAVDPPALLRHRAVTLALAAAVLLALLVLAWSVGMLG